jgi:tyrosinase
MEHLNLASSQLNRRVFIKGMGWISAGLIAGLTLGGCEGCKEKIKNRPIRRRLRTGSPEVDAAINTYRQAIELMKARSAANAADPRGLMAQAGIHGTVAGGFNLCQHGTNHFFSWHRAYLVWFERICQELTGDKNFGLPYWNWNQNPAIHPAFLDPSSALFMPRTRTSMAGLTEVSDSQLNTIFSDTNFFSFSSQLEGTPHNTTHTWIGGDFRTGGSANDPIFWMHHCMIDYCWAKWNIELGNNNTNDPAWNSMSWNHFFDKDGNPVDTTAGATTLMPLLSYQYESSAIGSHGIFDVVKKDFKELETRIRKGADIKFDVRSRVPLADTATMSLVQPFVARSSAGVSDFARIINNDKASETVFVSVDFASLPPTSDFFVRVFLNAPNADRNTPVDDPHYAGSFAFFGTDSGAAGHEGGHKEHKPNFLVNITPTLERLRNSGELKDNAEIVVHLVPVPMNEVFEKLDATLRLTKVELIVTPVIIRSSKID